MKYRIRATILSLLFAVPVFAQNETEKSGVKKDTLTLERTFSDKLQTIHQNGKDSLVISIHQLDELTKLLKKDDSILKDILPSVIALLVVIISTVGAIYIGRKQINIQSKSGEEQLRSQEAQSQEQLKVSREQIQENSKLAIKQINTSNRQDWVIDTRNTISELMTQANLLNIEFQETILNVDKRKAIHEKFLYKKNKLYLLLKPEKEKHKLLLNSLDELLTILNTHLLNSNANNNPNLNIEFIPYDNGKFITQGNTIIDHARDLLYEEWAKIQS